MAATPELGSQSADHHLPSGRICCSLSTATHISTHAKYVHLETLDMHVAMENLYASRLPRTVDMFS